MRGIQSMSYPLPDSKPSNHGRRRMNAENKRRALDLVREIRVRAIGIEITEENQSDSAKELKAIRLVTHELSALLEAEPSE